MAVEWREVDEILVGPGQSIRVLLDDQSDTVRLQLVQGRRPKARGHMDVWLGGLSMDEPFSEALEAVAETVKDIEEGNV